MKKWLVTTGLYFLLFDLGAQFVDLTPQHVAVIPTLERLIKTGTGRIGGVYESGGAKWMIVYLNGRPQERVFALAEKLEDALGVGAWEWGFPSYLVYGFDHPGDNPRNPYEDQLLIGYWAGIASGPIPIPGGE